MTKLLRNPIDLGKLFRARRPTDRLDVLLDLLDAGGAGDDACDLRPRQQPRERQLEQSVPARLRKRLQLLDDVLVARRDVTVAQRRGFSKARGLAGSSAALVFSGHQAAGHRKEWQ